MRASSGRRGRRAGLVALAVAGLLGIGGCGGQPGGQSNQSRDASATATHRSNASDAPPVVPALASIRRVSSYRIPAADPVWLTLTRDGIAYGGAAPDGAPTVEVMPEGAKQPATIFTGPRGGVIDGIAAGTDYLSWTFEPFVQQDPTEPVPWTIYAYDLGTDKTEVVASSAKGSPLPPSPVINGHRVAWVDYLGIRRKSSAVYVANVRTGTTRKVLADVRTDQIALTGHSIIYNNSVRASSSPSDMGADDLFEFDLHTGASRRLTRIGSVDGPVAWGRWVAWESGSWDPGRKLGSLRLPDGPVLTLEDRLQGMLGVGAGFAVYDGVSGLDATALAPGAKPVRIASNAQENCPRCGFSVRGSRVAWAATHRGTTTVTVDAIGLS